MKSIAATIGIVVVTYGCHISAHAVCLDDRGVSGYHIPLDKELRDAHVVAIGTVVSRKDVPPPSSNDDEGTVYGFKVEETLSGARYKTINLFSPNNSGRFPMDIGRKYLVFVTKDHRVFSVSNCGSSGELPEQSAIVEAVRKKAGKG